MKPIEKQENFITTDGTKVRSLTLEEEQQLSILLAELYLKDGRLKEARQYLLRAVNKSGNKVFNRQAQNRMYDIREIMEDEKNKEVEANDEDFEIEVGEE